MPKPLATLLVDDEHLALELLENFVQRIPDLHIVGRFRSPIQAIEFLADHPVDLLFLDIQMPQLSGTKLLSILKNPPATIFTTAHAEFAVDAFALDATDYLLKPFSFDRFLQAVQKVRARREHLAVEPKQDVIAFRADGRLHRLPATEILFVEGMKEYVRIATKDKRYTVYLRLHQVESQLPSGAFLKVHRSYTVNIHQVQSLQGNRLFVGGSEVPVSRDLKADVTARLFPQ